MSVEIPAVAPSRSVPAIGSSLRRARPVVLPIATAAATLLLWQFAAVRLQISAVILPAPVEIAHELWRALPVLISQAGPTALDTLLAFAVAAVLGVGLCGRHYLFTAVA